MFKAHGPETPLDSWRGNFRNLTIEPAWTDLYGHMNMAWYVMIFDTLGHEILGDCGFGEAYTARENLGLFTVRAEVDYLREVVARDPVSLTVEILSHDTKRLRSRCVLTHCTKGYVAATMEQLALNVSLETRRVTPFPEATMRRLRALA